MCISSLTCSGRGLRRPFTLHLFTQSDADPDLAVAGVLAIQSPQAERVSQPRHGRRGRLVVLGEAPERSVESGGGHLVTRHEFTALVEEPFQDRALVSSAGTLLPVVRG